MSSIEYRTQNDEMGVCPKQAFIRIHSPGYLKGDIIGIR